MSFTEFTYGLLQGYDYFHLHANYQCSLQIGGSDQYGNIKSGIDFIQTNHKRMQDSLKSKANIDSSRGLAAFGLTVPLLTTADGSKFGKSAGNAIWMDRQHTSPYALYHVSPDLSLCLFKSWLMATAQYLLSLSDGEATKYLDCLTFQTLAARKKVLSDHQVRPLYKNCWNLNIKRD